MLSLILGSHRTDVHHLEGWMRPHASCNIDDEVGKRDENTSSSTTVAQYYILRANDGLGSVACRSELYITDD